MIAFAGRLSFRSMEIVLATAYLGAAVVALSWLLWWLAPGVPRWLAKSVPFFTPVCILVFVGAVLATSIVMRRPAPDEIDASGLALVAVIFTTALSVVCLLVVGGIGRLILSGATRKPDDHSPNR